MYEDIHRDGASAAQEGKSLLDNPYFKAAAMPNHTGEPIEEWHARVDAWESGWREATLKRSALIFTRKSGKPANRTATP